MVKSTKDERTARALAAGLSSRICEACGKPIATDKISVVKRVAPVPGSTNKSRTLTIYSHRGACPK